MHKESDGKNIPDVKGSSCKLKSYPPTSPVYGVFCTTGLPTVSMEVSSTHLIEVSQANLVSRATRVAPCVPTLPIWAFEYVELLNYMEFSFTWSRGDPLWSLYVTRSSGLAGIGPRDVGNDQYSVCPVMYDINKNHTRVFFSHRHAI